MKIAFINWNSEPMRRSAAIRLRETLLENVGEITIYKATKIHPGRVNRILNGVDVPTVDELLALKRFAKHIRDDMVRSVEATAGFYENTDLEALATMGR